MKHCYKLSLLTSSLRLFYFLQGSRPLFDSHHGYTITDVINNEETLLFSDQLTKIS